MNNQCEYYLQYKDERGEGLKPCTFTADYFLLYYNEFEDATKHFYFCKVCFAHLKLTNNEYINNPKSKVIELETLKPTSAEQKSQEWFKFANLPEEQKSRLIQ